jgi:hypothetical protein
MTLTIEWHHAEFCIFFIIILNVFMLNAVVLNVVAPHQLNPSKDKFEPCLSAIFSLISYYISKETEKKKL